MTLTDPHPSAPPRPQIVLGGRNKYMINGHTVEASRVHDMFQSVGLNVNNPHFLIMQGRITKVRGARANAQRAAAPRRASPPARPSVRPTLPRC
jgi:hypothetical protein